VGIPQKLSARFSPGSKHGTTLYCRGQRAAITTLSTRVSKSERAAKNRRSGRAEDYTHWRTGKPGSGSGS